MWEGSGGESGRGKNGREKSGGESEEMGVKRRKGCE